MRLFYAYSEKSEGNMSFHWGDPDETAESRSAFLSAIGVDPEKVIGMQLQHGTEIALVDETVCGTDSLEVDCLMTKSSGVFLSVLTGDCLPVIFYEPERKILALAHISRMNAVMHFARKIIERILQEECAVHQILVWIGPGVRKESYLFTPQELSDRDIGAGWENFVTAPANGKKGVDLAGYVSAELISAGVSKSNIEISKEDTISDKHFFSHYRSKKTGEPEGRMMTVAGIR